MNDEHRARSEEGYLKSRLEIANAKIELLKSHALLVKLAREFPEVDIWSDDEKLSFGKIGRKLSEEIKLELAESKRIDLDSPSEINIESFTAFWVKSNWIKIVEISGCSEEYIPKYIVEIALKDLLLESNKIDETREELLELNRKGPWKYHPITRFFVKKIRNIRDAISIKIYKSDRLTKLFRLQKYDKIEHVKKLEDNIKRRKDYLLQNKNLAKKTRSKRRAKELRDTRRQHSIQQMVTSASFLFTGLSAAFMLLMLCVGGIALGYALAQISLDNFYGGIKMSMSKALTALELILLAPLPYLLVLGLMRYIKALAYQERADEFRRELLEFKAFEVALFIAIIAASVVSRVLDDRLTISFAISVSLILIVLAAYYFIIEKASEGALEANRGTHNSTHRPTEPGHPPNDEKANQPGHS